MNDFANVFRAAVMWSGLLLLAAVAGYFAACLFARAARIARRQLGPSDLIVILAIAGVCTFAAQKVTTKVVYPRNDPTQAYLFDDGSYVTNSLVHVNFRRIIVPDDAPFLVSTRVTTNDAFQVVYSNSFENTALPLDIPYENAWSNVSWIAYTTWVPGQTVKTNGVWHAYWGVSTATNAPLRIIPIRTIVRTDGTRIAPPAATEAPARKNEEVNEGETEDEIDGK